MVCLRCFLDLAVGFYGGIGDKVRGRQPGSTFLDPNLHKEGDLH